MTFEEALRANMRAILHEEAEMFRAEIREVVRAELKAAPMMVSASSSADILSVSEAAATYKVKPKTIRAKIRAGHLPALRSHGSRLYRIRRGDLDACFSPTEGERPERSAEEQAASILSNIHRLQDK